MTGLTRRFIRDRAALLGLFIFLLLILTAIFAPAIAPYPDDISTFHIEKRLMPPSANAWLGTDRMGSDLLSLLILGTQTTLALAGTAVGSALLIGVPVGLVAGYYRNWISDGLMRIADIFLALPQIILAIAIAQTLGPSLQNVILALSLTYWPFWARLAYAETRSISNEIFVEAAVALGASPWRVIFLHILPNIAPPIIVRTTIGLGATILTAATLGFLGLGAPPTTPEWGSMIAQSRDYLPSAWWYALAPGFAIFVTVLGFNLLGDGLSDAMDSRRRQIA
jgi:peptide/nickel transport system permease protein